MVAHAKRPAQHRETPWILATALLFTSVLVVCGASNSPEVAPSPGRLTITNGGTYSGTWESQNPKVPAVDIRTRDPVTLQDCTIRSKGDLIHASVSDAKVTIRNCRGYGLDPMVAGKTRGNFFFAYQIGSLTAEHNTIEGANFGFVLYNTDGRTPGGPIVIRYNQAKNLDGVPSDGKGGRDITHLEFGQDNGNHFAILANLQGLSGTEISWNEVVSEPGTSSIGDVITIYSSSGTPTSPIQIHNNYIQGGYPADPFSTLYYAGGITMDGRATDTVKTATAFVKIHDNQVVGHANFGIGLAAGHDNEAYSNRVVSTGQYPGGKWYTGYAGIYVVNCALYHQPPSVYFNNWAHDNVVGFRFQSVSTSTPPVFSPPPVRQDYLLTDCAGGSTGPCSRCVGNVSLPDPITTKTEANEALLWQQKRVAHSITVGPTH